MSSENLLEDNFTLKRLNNGLKTGKSADDLDQIIGDIIGGKGVQYAELRLSRNHLNSVKTGQIEARDRANLHGGSTSGLYSSHSPSEWLSSDSLLNEKLGKIHHRGGIGTPPAYSFSPQLSCDSPRFEVRNPRNKIKKRLAQTRYVSTSNCSILSLNYSNCR